jgi:hypothetical protein
MFLACGHSSLLARIIHERSAFVNNAPTRAALAPREVSTVRVRGLLKASPEGRPAHAGRSRSLEGGLFTSS